MIEIPPKLKKKTKIPQKMTKNIPKPKKDQNTPKNNKMTKIPPNPKKDQNTPQNPQNDQNTTET